MKYILVVTVVMVAFWIWRNNRRQEQAQEERQRQARATRTSSPVRMVACGYCGTHLPETDAVAGSRGHYCSEDHRRRKE